MPKQQEATKKDEIKTNLPQELTPFAPEYASAQRTDERLSSLREMYSCGRFFHVVSRSFFLRLFQNCSIKAQQKCLCAKLILKVQEMVTLCSGFCFKGVTYLAATAEIQFNEKKFRNCTIQKHQPTHFSHVWMQQRVLLDRSTLYRAMQRLVKFWVNKLYKQRSIIIFYTQIASDNYLLYLIGKPCNSFPGGVFVQSSCRVLQQAKRHFRQCFTFSKKCHLVKIYLAELFRVKVTQQRFAVSRLRV